MQILNIAVDIILTTILIIKAISKGSDEPVHSHSLIRSVPTRMQYYYLKIHKIIIYAKRHAYLILNYIV